MNIILNTKTTNRAPLLEGKKILWLEDDSFLADVIAKKLTEEKAQSLYARESKEVLEMAKKEKPHVILLDILVPGMDGIQVLAQLKSTPETKDIPVIMFSNLNDKAKIDESMKLGASKFFTKANMNMDDVTNEIVKLLTK